MKDFNVLTEGRYEHASDIEYKILRQHVKNDQVHLVFTGVLKTKYKYSIFIWGI